MAGALAQRGVHSGTEGFQQVKGNKGLDGPGKTAAVDPVGSPALEVVLAQRQSQGHILMLGITRRDHIL